MFVILIWTVWQNILFGLLMSWAILQTKQDPTPKKKKKNLDLSSWGWQHVKFYKGHGKPSKQMCFTPHVAPNMWYQILTKTSRACVRSISKYGSCSVRSMVVLDLTWSDHIDVSTLQLYLEPDSTAMDLTPSSNQSSSTLLSTWPNWSAPLIDTPALLRRQRAMTINMTKWF